MIYLKWHGREQYRLDGKSPLLTDIFTGKRWDWGFVELALNRGEDITILGELEEEEEE